MANLKQTAMLPDELEFLRPFLQADGPRYESAPWLRALFESTLWRVVTKCSFDIDWNILVGRERVPLTSKRCQELWRALRSWLIVQTHVDVTGGRLHGSESEYRRLRYVVTLIDYLLLNADALGLVSHGLGLFTASDAKAMLGAVASSRAVSTSVYRWPERLGEELRKQGRCLSALELEKILREAPFLSHDIPSVEERLTNLDEMEIVAARAVFWRSGHYHQASHARGFRYTFNSAILSKQLYANTIAGASTNHASPPEMGLLAGHFATTEFPRSPVVLPGRDVLGKPKLIKYVEAVRTLSLLQVEGLSAPSLDEQELVDFAHGLSLKPNGRFRTLPVESVLSTMRTAIEHTLINASEIARSIASVAEAAANTQLTLSEFARATDITPYLTDRTKELGVRVWTIETFTKGPNGEPRSLMTSAEYFRALRANTGLWECFRVVLGAVQVVVGLLMARRQAELRDLNSNSCLDVDGKYLIFKNRKSGIKGIRQEIARPIPQLGVLLIRKLIRLQQDLVQAGYLSEVTNLFGHLRARGKNGFVRMTSGSYNQNLDLFCDWAEVPLDSSGRRFYLRQHQLRRLFCMLFFWGNSFGGLETLRFFLGQTDPAHLYNYITESTPGAVLRGAAAEWATHHIQHGQAESDDLSEELFEAFGTRDFEILDADTLQSYLELLMEDGRLSIEPEFLDGGKRYRIAVRLKARVLA